MLAETIPDCPRLHHGIMAVDPEEEYGIEFVCRLCGTRIYPNKPELIPAGYAGQEKKFLLGDCAGCGKPYDRRKEGYRCRRCKVKAKRSPGVCIDCGSPSDTHLLCRSCRSKDK